MRCFPASALRVSETFARARLLSLSSIQPFATKYLFTLSRVMACIPIGTMVVCLRSAGVSRMAMRRMSRKRRWLGLTFLPAAFPALGADLRSIGTTTGACGPSWKLDAFEGKTDLFTLIGVVGFHHGCGSENDALDHMNGEVNRAKQVTVATHPVAFVRDVVKE